MKFTPEARVRVEDFFEENQITRHDDGFMTVTVSFPEDQWVHNTLLSFGEHCEILKPPHIRKLIAEKARKIQNNNS